MNKYIVTLSFPTTTHPPASSTRVFQTSKSTCQPSTVIHSCAHRIRPSYYLISIFVGSAVSTSPPRLTVHNSGLTRLVPAPCLIVVGIPRIINHFQTRTVAFNKASLQIFMFGNGHYTRNPARIGISKSNTAGSTSARIQSHWVDLGGYSRSGSINKEHLKICPKAFFTSQY